jgi:hypothetical protein
MTRVLPVRLKNATSVREAGASERVPEELGGEDALTQLEPQLSMELPCAVRDSIRIKMTVR